jgi:hypothetical protein
MNISLDATFAIELLQDGYKSKSKENLELRQKLLDLERELTRLRGTMMRPLNDRAGASMNPIEVNGDKISPENRPAVGQMMNRTNQVLSTLVGQEQQ